MPVLNEMKQSTSLKKRLKDEMLKNNDLDYLDMLYREKFKYGTEDEIIIKLK